MTNYTYTTETFRPFPEGRRVEFTHGGHKDKGTVCRVDFSPACVGGDGSRTDPAHYLLIADDYGRVYTVGLSSVKVLAEAKK